MQRAYWLSRINLWIDNVLKNRHYRDYRVEVLTNLIDYYLDQFGFYDWTD